MSGNTMVVDISTTISSIAGFIALYCMVNPDAGRGNWRTCFLIFPNFGIGLCFWGWLFLLWIPYFFVAFWYRVSCGKCFKKRRQEWWPILKSQFMMSTLCFYEKGYKLWKEIQQNETNPVSTSNNDDVRFELVNPMPVTATISKGAESKPIKTQITGKDGTVIPLNDIEDKSSKLRM